MKINPPYLTREERDDRLKVIEFLIREAIERGCWIEVWYDDWLCRNLRGGDEITAKEIDEDPENHLDQALINTTQMSQFVPPDMIYVRNSDRRYIDVLKVAIREVGRV
jgi:hypothetical protein